VKPGETSRVTLGGTGREIVGKAVFSGRKDYGIWHLDAQTLELKIAGPPGLTKPVRSDYPSPEAYYEALRKYNAQAAPYWKSPAGQAAERSQRRYDLVFQPNGQFHVNDVPPGTYVVEINLPGPSMNGSLYPIGFLRQEVEVPDGDENIPVEWEPLVVPVVPQTSAALPKN